VVGLEHISKCLFVCCCLQEHTRNLRAEQDAEYEAALAADREREAAREEERRAAEEAAQRVAQEQAAAQ
jgi:hypothetical protein